MPFNKFIYSKSGCNSEVSYFKKMQKSWIFVALCGILVANFLETEAACRWNFGNPGTECLMQCINLNTTNIIKEVEDYYSQVN